MRYQSLVAALSLLGSAALALHDQFPINTAGETGARPLDAISSNPDHLNSISSNEQWSFDECPSENATGNLIFNTVHSLLQHWPNTRHRNGHNIVPGVIPIGTLLYHGTNGSLMIPSEPEWTATDPEHAIFFSRGNESGWLFTLAATRPLKVLYFDGNSAAKLSEGMMDVQDIISWGEPRPERFFDERERIDALCTWGKEFGIDGFASEVMLCDFTAGIEVVSFVHITLPRDDRSFPHSTSLDPNTLIRTYEVLHVGLWHNRYPGDSRIVLDLTGLISLYDTALAPSLISVRAGLGRPNHRVLGISSDDISRVMRKLIEVITRPQPAGSGIDWKTLIHVIVDRYADRLELTQYLLNVSSSDPQELLERAKLAQTQLPCYAHAISITFHRHPKGRHFRHIFIAITKLKPLMTSSELLLLKAVEDTTREICRVTTKMWAVGVMSGLDTLFPIELNGGLNVAQIMDDWRQDIQKLMSWLDWSVWIKCRPACGPEEMCYLSTWPVNARRPGGPLLSPRNSQSLTNSPEEYVADRVGQPRYPKVPAEDWDLPQPRCIRRLQPYGF
ncbi:hypothetical protein DFJ58DRAFT_852411 [Suillus subalutaceus]|uniref:uncharacterized protein n=1 Tax=Suillus subalutaceus TaxID=48586 RepID=UPI001B85D1BD|nr:uncharacterized protein DFJ58DRAFT_852411 [Suillus subalutaceus]KAG1870659.1 hypothetical protein DFJ58DRAFT_852411 [Suillus subalutaceus]